MKKVLYFDTETTGLDEKQNDIIQIAGIIVIYGVVQEEFEFKVQPFNYDNISQEALDIHGYNVEQLKTFPEPGEIYLRVIDIFSKYIDKYNKEDKFTPAGYNVEFDLRFLQQFFQKNNDVYFGSWVNWKKIDPLPLLYYLDYCNRINLPNYKLATVCQHFEIELKAHDALGDIRATRELLAKLHGLFFKNGN
ncbi:MAG: 3'-5' exonuclease [Ignavibacteriaceae bacterium]|jgi:DNA polymerase-3 subunit epsilon|nr:3'-5' exonuclease [Ignavibacteriaceae bacterium]